MKTWLAQKGLFVKRTDTAKRPVTHLLMDGGNLSIPPELEEEFLSILQADPNPTFVVEKKTEPNFYFFVDIDLYEPESCPLEQAIRYVSLIIEVLCQFYPPDAVPDALLCMAESTSSKARMKTGIHAIFRDLVVDARQSLVIRQAIIQRATERYGARSSDQNPWEEVFDPSVYKANGLRMVGCNKIEPCPRCTVERRRKANRSCSICHGTQKHDVGRVYAALHMIDRQGQVHPLPSGFSLRHSSIRLCSPEDRTSGFSKPDWLVVTPPTTTRKRRRTLPPIQANEHDEQHLAKDDPRYQHLIYLLRKHCQISSTLVVDMTARKGHFLIRTTSRDCQNKTEPHKTARIFFLVTRNGIQQRCFCKCNEAGVTGQPCKDHPLPTSSIKAYSKNLLFAGGQDPSKRPQGHTINPVICYSEEDQKFTIGILNELERQLKVC